MNLIGITGPHSNSGKTTLLCRLLRLLPGRWGAIKWTSLKEENRTVLEKYDPAGLERGWGIIRQMEVIDQRGKDTCRMMEAGAGQVFWVISHNTRQAEAWQAVQSQPLFEPMAGWLIEGTSFLEVVPVDRLFFALGAGQKDRWKKGAEKLVQKAHGIFGFSTHIPKELSSEFALPPVPFWGLNSPEDLWPEVVKLAQGD